MENVFYSYLFGLYTEEKVAAAKKKKHGRGGKIVFLIHDLITID